MNTLTPLSDADMEAYRRPYPTPESRRPLLEWARAIPFDGEPADVATGMSEMVSAAQSIATLPYIWGGGHGSWISPGYDCSGSVSFVLHAAGLLSALKKLEQNDKPFKGMNHATAAMCIDDPLQHHETWYHRLYDTHPPIEQRIAALEKIASGQTV